MGRGQVGSIPGNHHKIARDKHTLVHLRVEEVNTAAHCLFLPYLNLFSACLKGCLLLSDGLKEQQPCSFPAAQNSACVCCSTSTHWMHVACLKIYYIP